ncbi:MAG: hypothetical protein ACR2F1_06490 [Nitrososphaeraceae archaeon]
MTVKLDKDVLVAFSHPAYACIKIQDTVNKAKRIIIVNTKYFIPISVSGI